MPTLRHASTHTHKAALPFEVLKIWSVVFTAASLPTALTFPFLVAPYATHTDTMIYQKITGMLSLPFPLHMLFNDQGKVLRPNKKS